jgi:hypothetical protein
LVDIRWEGASSADVMLAVFKDRGEMWEVIPAGLDWRRI